jgi:hypothetical protein
MSAADLWLSNRSDHKITAAIDEEIYEPATHS